MKTLSLIAHGFRTARKHPRLVLIAWLVPLVPALILIAMVASNIGPVLGRSLFSQGIMEGHAFPVYIEFRTSPADALDPIFGRGVLVMAFLSLLTQIFLSAGIVEVLTGSGRPHPFLAGVRRNSVRFLRSALSFLILAIPAAVLAGLTVKGAGELAKHFSDGRWDVAGLAAASVVFAAFFAPVALAYDLSRIASVHHDHRSMFRGILRSLALVLKNPGTYVPLFLAFLALPVVLHGIYSAVRQPWTPSSAVAVVLLALTHQIVMAVRAMIKISFWAAEVEVYRGLDEPDLCLAKQKTRLEVTPPAEMTPEEEMPISEFASEQTVS